mmetsp:Transcript_119996/g.299304  ORF Transcript_119996/g.299304 Transcript_119996/m.299304 type:complete len:202 (+) Transcript_119996:523-1128(+)
MSRSHSSFPAAKSPRICWSDLRKAVCASLSGVDTEAGAWSSASNTANSAIAPVPATSWMSWPRERASLAISPEEAASSSLVRVTSLLNFSVVARTSLITACSAWTSACKTTAACCSSTPQAKADSSFCQACSNCSLSGQRAASRCWRASITSSLDCGTPDSSSSCSSRCSATQRSVNAAASIHNSSNLASNLLLRASAALL